MILDDFPKLRALIGEATAPSLERSSFGNGCGSGYRCYKDLYVRAMTASMMMVLCADDYPRHEDPPLHEISDREESILRAECADADDELDLFVVINRMVPRWRDLF